MTDIVNNVPMKSESEEEQFDIVWLIAYLWAKRKIVLISVGVCLLFGFILYFSKPKQYSVSMSVLPMSESSEKSGMGGLSNLASMAGISLGGGGASSTIKPELYSTVLMSTPSLLSLMEVPIHWTSPCDTILSVHQHTILDSVPSVGDLIAAYTIHLPATIMASLNPPPVVVADIPTVDDSDQMQADTRPITLDFLQTLSALWLQQHISISIDDETNLVSIDITGDSPKQVTMLGEAVLKHIQQCITNFKTKNARAKLAIIEARYNDALSEYEEVRNQYNDYCDSHRNYIEERSSIVRQRLEDKYNLSYNLLNSLQTEVEKSRMELLSNTPAFSIVEPAVTPLKKSSPKLLIHLIGGIVLGFIGSVGYLLVMLSYYQVFKPKRFKEIYEEYMVVEEV